MTDHEAVRHVLARYVRAADARDGDAMQKLFLPDGRVDIYEGQGSSELVGSLVGAHAIGLAVAAMLPAHAPRGWSHHVTTDHLIEVDGDRATMDAQFVMFVTLGRERPAGGWLRGARGAQGTVAPMEAGYYRSELVRVDGTWRLLRHCIHLDLPPAFDQATG